MSKFDTPNPIPLSETVVRNVWMKLDDGSWGARVLYTGSPPQQGTEVEVMDPSMAPEIVKIVKVLVAGEEAPYQGYRYSVCRVERQ